MQRTSLPRPFLKAIAWALLLALAVSQGLDWARDFRAARASAVASAAIHAGHALEVCPHHPQGCPKDCMCPKVKLEDSGSGVPASDLAQPFLTQCTEKGPSDIPAPAAPFLIVSIVFCLPPDRSEALPEADQESLSAAFRDPAEKVPRA